MLTECMAESGPGEHERACDKYYNRRFKRTNKVVDTAWYLGATPHAHRELVRENDQGHYFKLLFWGGGNCLFMKVATK